MTNRNDMDRFGNVSDAVSHVPASCRKPFPRPLAWCALPRNHVQVDSFDSGASHESRVFRELNESVGVVVRVQCNLVFCVTGLLDHMIQASRPVLKSAGSNSKRDYLVLVLDHRTLRVISSALSMYDIMQEGLACTLDAHS